jgi:hypothetical protein
MSNEEIKKQLLEMKTNKTIKVSRDYLLALFETIESLENRLKYKKKYTKK